MTSFQELPNRNCSKQPLDGSPLVTESLKLLLKIIGSAFTNVQLVPIMTIIISFENIDTKKGRYKINR